MGLREEYERRKREEVAEREQRTQQRMQNTPDRTSIKLENASMNEAARSAHRNERINRRTSQRNTSDSSNAVDYFNRVRAARTSNTTRKPYSVDQYNATSSTHSIYNQTHEATPVKFDNDALFRMRMQNSPYMNTVNMFQNTPTDNVPQMSEEQINQFNSNYFNPVTSSESVYDDALSMAMQNSPYMNTMNVIQNNIQNATPYSEALAESQKWTNEHSYSRKLSDLLNGIDDYETASQYNPDNSSLTYDIVNGMDDRKYANFVNLTNPGTYETRMWYRDDISDIEDDPNNIDRHTWQSAKGYDFLTDEERQNYNAIYNTYGEEAGQEYLDNLGDLTQRKVDERQEKMQEYGSDHPYLALGTATAEATFGAPLSALEMVFDNAFSRETDLNQGLGYRAVQDRNSLIQGGSEAVADSKLGRAMQSMFENASESAFGDDSVITEYIRNNNVASGLYGLSESMLENGTRMLISGITTSGAMSAGASAAAVGKATASMSAAQMMIGAAGQKYVEDIQDGKNQTDAMFDGMINGIVEGITEKIALDNLFGGASGIVRKTLSQMFVNGIQEGAATALDNAADFVIFGDESQFVEHINEYINEGYSKEEAIQRALMTDVLQIGADSIGGVIMGAGEGVSASSITNAFNERRNASNVSKSSDARNSIVEIGLESQNDETRTLAQSVADGDTSKKTIRSLIKAVSSESNIFSNIMQSFENKGISEEYAAENAQAVLKYMNGDSLNQSEQIALESEVGQSVLNEINEGQYDANYENTIAINDALEMARNTRKSNNRANVETEVSNPQTATTEAENRAETATAEAENSNDNVVSEKTRPSLSQIAQVRDSQAQVQKAIEEGKNIRVNSSDVAEIVNSTEDGTTVRLNNGMEVDSSQLVFESRDMNRAYENAAKFNDKVVAENYIDSYIKASEANTNGVLTENTFNGFWNMYYEAGENAAQTFDQVTSSLNSNYKDLYNSVVAPNIAMQSAIRMAYAYGENKAARNSAVRASEEQVKAVESFAKILNANVQFTDEKNNTNGYYKDGTIYISRYADKAAVSVFSHEFTHRLKQTSTEGFNEYRDFVVNFLKKEDGRYESLIENLKKNYGELSEEDIQEELVANSTESFLFDKKFAHEVASSNKSLAKKIVNLIDTMLKEIKAAFGERESISAEAIYLESDVEALKKAKKLWLKAIKNAEVNTTENTTNINKSIKTVHTDTGLIAYTEAQLHNWENSNKIITYTSKEQCLNFIDDALNNKTNKTMYFGIIPENTVEMIRNATDIDVSNRNLTLTASEVRKIRKDHGNDSELLRGQSPITRDDYVQIPRIITSDNASVKSVDEYYGSPLINITDGKYTVAVVVAGNSLTVRTQTMYKKRSLSNAIDEQASINTPLATNGTASFNESISSLSNKRKNSMKNSQGGTLTQAQAEYFKDSKVRDEDGNLAVVYHGTPRGGFTVFKNDLNFFTTNKSYADGYQEPSASARVSGKEKTNAMTYEGYLNIKKPFDILHDSEARDLFINEYVKGGWAQGINPYMSDVEIEAQIKDGIDWVEADNLKEFFDEEGYDYDGLVLNEGGYFDNDGNVVDRGTSYVTFNSNQFKNIDNENPTSNEDIRFSKKDSAGRELTESQQKYFENSKIRDEEGNLLVLYHGTDNYGFTKFNTKKNRKGLAGKFRGIFLTDNANVAKTYEHGYENKGGTYEVYANITNPYVYDAKGESFHNWTPDNYATKYMQLRTEQSGSGKVFAYWYDEDGTYRHEDFTNEEFINKFGNKVVMYGRNNLTDQEFGTIFLDKNGDNIPTSTDEIVEYARSHGYDGAIIKNVRDMGYIENSDEYETSNVILALRSSQIKNVDNEKPTNSRDIRYSMKNSNGATLTEAQAEYFKDSKVKDENGNLKVVYHGTGADFTVFEHSKIGKNGSAEGYGFYFTDVREKAAGYEADGGKIMEGYLNIQNPLSLDSLTLKKSDVKNLIKALDETGDEIISDYDMSGGVGYPSASWYNKALNDAVNTIMENESDVDAVAEIANIAGKGETLSTIRSLLGYDGFIASEKYSDGEVYVAFESNQFKNIDNLNPTNDADIRYSLKQYAKDMKLSMKLDDAWDALMDEEYQQYLDSEEGKYVENEASILEEGFDILKGLKSVGGANFTHNKAVQIAKTYIQQYNSTYGVENLAKNIEAVFAYIQSNDVNYGDMIRVMKEVARPVLEYSRGNTEYVEQSKPFRDYVKSLTLSLNASQKAEVIYTYGSMDNFRKAVGSKITIRENGTNIDNVWSEICEKSGYLLDPDEGTNTQVIALANMIETMSDGISAFDNRDAEQSAYDIALNIYTDFFKNVKAEDSDVTKIKQKMAENVQKYEEAVDLRFSEMIRQMEEAKKAEVENIKKQYQARLEDYKASNEVSLDEEVQLEEMRAKYLKLEKQLEKAKNLNKVNEAWLNATKAAAKAQHAEERNKHYAEIKRLKKELNQKLAENRQLRDEAIERVKMENRAGRLRAAESRRMTQTRNSIRKIVEQLSKMITNPTDGSHIPSGLINSTIEVLNAIDLNTGRSEKMAERLSALKDQYEKVKAGYGEDANPDFDEDTYAKISRLKAIFDNKSIAKLTAAELDEVLEICRAVRTQIQNTNKFIESELNSNIFEAGKNIIDDVMAVKGEGDGKLAEAANKYLNTSLNAMRFFRRLVGYKENSSMLKLVDELNEGSHKQMQIKQEVSDIMKPVIEGDKNQKEVMKLTGEKMSDWIDTPWKDSNGNTIKVPAAMRISLALHMQNNSNMRHIIHGGLTLPNAKSYRAGNMIAAYGKNGHTIQLIDYSAFEDIKKALANEDLTVEERERLVNKYRNQIKKAELQAMSDMRAWVNGMSDFEKKVMDSAAKYFHEYSGKKINETSIALNGYTKARVENYFPIKTDRNFTATDVEGVRRDASLEGWGNLKSRTYGGNPIVLEDVFNVINNHSDFLAKYAGLAIPIRNFNKVYKVTLPHHTNTVKKSISLKWGDGAKTYIENLMTDLQTSRSKTDGFSRFMNTLRGNFAQATLTTNISVAWKQAASFPTAAYSLGWDAVGASLMSKNGIDLVSSFVTPFWMKPATRRTMELARQYTPLLDYRNAGNSTQELGDLRTQRTLLDRVPGVNKAVRGLTNWIQNIDTTTVATLWKAAEYRVSKDYSNLQKGTDEYYQQVAKVFNKAVEDTQPNYTVMQRPDILRSPNEFTKQVFMFKTQPLQNLGIVVDATGNLQAKLSDKNATKAEKAAAVKDFALAISSQTVAAITFAGMTLAANALMHRMDRYRDEDKELTWESIWNRFINDVGSCFAGALPLGSEVYDFIQAKLTGNTYYGLQVSTVEMANDFLDHFNKLYDALTKEDGVDVDNARKYAESLAMDAGSIAGVPLKNVKNIIKGIFLHAEDYKNDEFGSFEAGVNRNKNIEYHRMMEAFLDGDSNKATEIKKALYDELGDDLYDSSHLGGYLKKQYESGQITTDEALNILEKAGADEDEAYWMVNKWETGSESHYDALENAILSGKTRDIDDALDELLDHGYTEEKILQSDKFRNAMKESLFAGDLSDNEAVDIYMSLGFSKDDATEKVESLYEARNSDTRSDIKDSYLSGSISQSEAIKRLEESGLDENEVHWKIVSWDTGSNSHYINVYSAIESNDTTAMSKALEELNKYGYPTDGNNWSCITSQFKPIYIELYNTNKTEAANLKNALLNFYAMVGKDREDKSEDIDKWVE